jgi:hypothetical protein
MTVSSTTNRIPHIGDGVTVTFTVNFYFLDAGDLTVYVDNVLQTITTDYTVTGAGVPAGGTVTFATAPANLSNVVIFRDPEPTQPLDYIENDNFPAESHELGLDRLTMIAQRNRDLINRAIGLPDSVVGFDPLMPQPTARKIIGINEAGDGLELYEIASVAPNGTFTTILCSGNATIGGDLTVSGAGTFSAMTASTAIINGSVASAHTGFKNKIIGGDFGTNPWQRGTSFTSPATGVFTADRWQVVHANDGAADILKTADSPTPEQAGHYSTHCLHADVTTADTSIAAGQFYTLRHTVEGYNSASFGFGQSGLRYVTLSFWHKHTKTGTNCVSIVNSAANRCYIAEYTQSVSDTWEKATITIPVDTSGTWLYDSGAGLRMYFALAAGTTYQGTAGAWQAGNFYASANQVNNLDSTSNNFKIALVQLESGQNATQFEARSIQDEFNLCSRTTINYGAPSDTVITGERLGCGFAISTSQGIFTLTLPTIMRSTPSMSYTDLQIASGATTSTVTGVSPIRLTKNVFTFTASCGAVLSVKDPLQLRFSSTSSSLLLISEV